LRSEGCFFILADRQALKNEHTPKRQKAVAGRGLETANPHKKNEPESRILVHDLKIYAGLLF